MKWLAVAILALSGGLDRQCMAEVGCPQVEIEANVRVAHSELTLADLLAVGSCAPARQAAAEISLGSAPRLGKTRVLDGQEIRRRIEALLRRIEVASEVAGQIPDRVAVRRAGGMKSCAEMAKFVLGNSSWPAGARGGKFSGEELDCAGAQSIPEDAGIELVRSSWNRPLRRREFAVRCARTEDCVPFLLWTRGNGGPGATGGGAALSSGVPSSREPHAEPSEALLVKPGQTVMLRWDQGGIRVVLPVTCLDGGGLGEHVRARLKNAARILPAEVLQDGTLRASL
jgi:hypothetical protein